MPIAKHSILLVDDDVSLLKLLQEFAKDHFLNVFICDSVDAALSVLKKENIDAIISDYRMPGKDGLYLLREAFALFPHIHFFMFTGYIDDKDLQSFPENKKFHLVEKPLDPGKLIKLINKVLSE